MKLAWKFSHISLALLLATGVATAADPVVRSYASPTGDVYGSISVQLSQQQPQREQVRHVVLVDTSASQAGEHRTVGLQALESFLQTLPNDHTAMVLAVDLAAVPMMQNFAAPGVAATEALANLQARFPAGSTNLSKGLHAAVKLLEGDQPGSITIIGDGMSAAALVQLEELQQLTTELRTRQIPVHAFAVGANLDLQLLGVLAQETGGFIVRDQSEQPLETAAENGSRLAAAAVRGISYPQTISVTADDVTLLPNRPLPLRSDRETVYLYQGTLTGEVRFTADSATWQLPVARSQGNTFLQVLWHGALESDGLVLGLAGESLVNLTQQTFEDQVLRMEAEGVKALETGAFQAAEQIGFALQEVDPGNSVAVQLINQAGEKLLIQTVQFEDNDAVDAAVEAAQSLPELEGREAPRGESAIEEYRQLQTARTQALRAEIDRGIERALSVLNIDPDASLGVLNQLRGAIKSAQDIDPEVRNQLLRRLASTTQDVISRKQKIALEVTERNKRLVEIEAQRRLIDYATERDAKLEQMVDRIRALLLEGYQGDETAFESAEAVGRQVLSQYPGSSMGVSVVFVSEAAGQLDKADRLRALRSDKFLETLHQVELSHVPFPDEPPILYPPAEVWQAITIMREKWKSVDLRTDNPNEIKIYAALEMEANMEFPGNPLKDVMDYISSEYNIPIRLDREELSNEGVSEDEEVELVLSGIKLRSALKLLLEPLGLTYVIEDEVMKITTILASADKLQTRVYNVGDLVIPIFPLGGGMGGGMGMGMGGGMGGMGGGMGGMGGMGGGMGGMGGMGGGMGMGMGQFSVPVEPVPSKKKLIQD